MTNDFFDGYKYDKSSTESSPIIVRGTLIDYAALINKEGGKTKIKNVSVINMDAIKNSLELTPKPKSMDVAVVVSKQNIYMTNSIQNVKNSNKYILADFKFRIKSINNVDKNISNEDIKGKFTFSIGYIREKDLSIPCSNIAYFVFNDKNFEQIKNVWKRRNCNSPKNMPIKQSDFEILFAVS